MVSFLSKGIHTSFSFSFILVAGWVFLPPVMLRTAPILYHMREWGLESTILNEQKIALRINQGIGEKDKEEYKLWSC